MMEPTTLPGQIASANGASGCETQIVVLDTAGVITSANPAWQRFSEVNGGDRAKTCVGANYLAACDAAPEEPAAAEVASAIRTALAGEFVDVAIVAMSCHSPIEQRWFDVLVSSHTDAQGSTTGATVVLTPTGAHRREAAEITVISSDVVGLRSHKTNSPLSDIPGADGAVAWAMVEASPDALVMADADGLIELVNGQAEKLFGYDRLELLGRRIEMLLPDRLVKAHTAHRTRFQAAPQTRAMGTEMELRARRADGSEVPVEVSLSPLQVHGQLRVIAAIRDITDRVAAEHEALIVQHSINSVSDAVFICDEYSLEFVHVNQGAVDLHGFTREELLAGMTPADLAPDLVAEHLAVLLEQLKIAPNQFRQISTIGVAANGDRLHVDIRVNWPAPSSPTSARPVVAVVRDMTAHVEAEQRQHAAESKFRTAFDDGPVPMTITEISPVADRVIVEANQAMADLVDYPISDLVGMSVANFSHPDDLIQDNDATRHQLDGTHETFTARKRYIRSDGQVLWVDVHVRVLSRRGDRVLIIANSIDITAALEVEQAKLRRATLNNALSQIRLKMLEGASRSEALDLVCAGTRDVLDATSVLVLTPSGAGTELQIEAASGISRAVRASLSFHTDQGVAGEVFATGTPHYTGLGDERIPPTNMRVVERHQCESILLAPLPGANEIFGVLLVARTDANNPLNDTDLATIEVFAMAAVAAVELAAVRETRTRLEVFEDRERMGRDMHDKVIGRLFATGMTLQTGAAHVAEPAVKQRIIAAVDQIDQAIKEIRTAVFGGRSDSGQGSGINDEILAIAADQNEVLGFEPSVSLSGPIADLPAAIADEILATMREAFTNIAKYAQATAVAVAVTAGVKEVELVMKDNGVGFETEPVVSRGTGLRGNGLPNIIRRAEIHGGHAIITSAPGQGTTISWTVPNR